MTGESAVEQRSVGGRAVPCVGVASVAPGIEAERLLKMSLFVGYDIPAAEIVGVDIMQHKSVISTFRHSKDTAARIEIGEAMVIVGIGVYEFTATDIRSRIIDSTSRPT